MNPNVIPKYSKVELLLKAGVKRSGIQDVTSITKHEFEDCGLMITGDYIIVIIDEKNDIQTSLTSTGKIYPLSEVSAYKTHAQ